MNPTLDPLFGIHTRALELWQKRAEVLASNLANADTPGYLARDIDFKAALANAGSDPKLAMTATSTAHLGNGGNLANGSETLAYRVPLQPSLDGNTVDVQGQQAAFAENASRYQASLTFINAQIHLLRTAITGS